MDITVVGASGACGREIVIQMIRDRILSRLEILQLVSSNPNSKQPYLLDGFRADLQDAYAESIPDIDVTNDPEKIIGDVVIITGGVTFETETKNVGNASRDMLANANLSFFEKIAQGISRSRPVNPPMVIIVSNPVELGVYIFSKYLPREYVIGMGAYSDSLRFRWEIATELGIRRQRVQGYIAGEHGNGMVPLWSTVQVHGINPDEWSIIEKKMRKEVTTHNFSKNLSICQKHLINLLLENPTNGPKQAIDYVKTLPPDLCVALKPFAIHYSKAKTISATATATVDLISSIVTGRPVEIAAQYMHDGENEFLGPMGARIIIGYKVESVLPCTDYREEELRQLKLNSKSINQKIKEWTND